ncbi:thioredoxin family protein [Mucilaginibacter corticis]|uniref:Thioredoxin family protein n=1 Tax=Mucilaginibacter corticis TaxID=2597670 RepID=A0A556MBD7_9SPHI|nr:thioredoxin family protein [Mucilaginibacter corticis]TSJ37211.1 thioredoxin family protein [Mucilaginibacter corticis]
MKKQILLFATIFLSAATLSFAQDAPAPSDAVLKQAYVQAKKEHKNVLLMFHASWCGWCKKMDASLNDPSCKKFIDDNYVVTQLDVLEQPAKANLENPGSLDQLKAFKGEKSGLPFWVILDAKGKLLADSQIRPKGASLDTPGESMGCPAQESEVAYFAQILKSTSKLNDEQLAVISKRFALNKPVPAAKPVTSPSSK